MQNLIWKLNKKQVQGIRSDWHEGQVSRRAPALPAATGSRPGQHQEATENLCHRDYKSHVCGMRHWERIMVPTDQAILTRDGPN